MSLQCCIADYPDAALQINYSMHVSLYFRSELAVGFLNIKQSFQLLREQNFLLTSKRRRSCLQMKIQCKTPLTSMGPRCRVVT